MTVFFKTESTGGLFNEARKLFKNRTTTTELSKSFHILTILKLKKVSGHFIFD